MKSDPFHFIKGQEFSVVERAQLEVVEVTTQILSSPHLHLPQHIPERNQNILRNENLWSQTQSRPQWIRNQLL